MPAKRGRDDHDWLKPIVAIPQGQSLCNLEKKIHKEQGITTGQKLAMSLTKTSCCVQLLNLEKVLYLIN